MSELKVNSIKGVGASTAAITINNSNGTCTANITNNLSNRNLIINGSQIIDQRNSGSNVTAHLAYPTDRFRIIKDTSSGSFTAARSTDAPSGFKNSLLFTTGTAYTPSSSENNFIKYVIEGNDSAQLDFGNSGAKTITLSFYVKSSLTGNFAASIVNGASNRSFPFSYSIGSADTWTRITKTITGDTTGTWATDNGAGMQVIWALGVGSNFEGTADSWQGSAEYAVSGHVKVTSTASATFAITGVQLEVDNGSGVATDFEHRTYAQELWLCSRYYQQVWYYRLTGSTSDDNMYYEDRPFFPHMRAAPSLVAGYDTNNENDFETRDGTTWRTGVPTLIISKTFGASVRSTNSSRYNSIKGILHYSAEL